MAADDLTLKQALDSLKPICAQDRMDAEAGVIDAIQCICAVRPHVQKMCNVFEIHVCEAQDGDVCEAQDGDVCEAQDGDMRAKSNRLTTEIRTANGILEVFIDCRDSFVRYHELHKERASPYDKDSIPDIKRERIHVKMNVWVDDLWKILLATRTYSERLLWSFKTDKDITWDEGAGHDRQEYCYQGAMEYFHIFWKRVLRYCKVAPELIDRNFDVAEAPERISYL